MDRQSTFGQIKEIGIVPAIRPSTAGQALHAAEAICKGGVPIVEISMAMPDALLSIRAVKQAFEQHILLGAGSVLDAEGVNLAHAAGAQFIVTSGFSADAVQAAHRLNMPILVGALTPTEVQAAAATEPEAVKLFPCFAVGGPRYVRSLRSQYPQTELVASGGVGLENCADYLRAGACAIGVGGEIGDSESMAAGDHRLFTERARRFRKAVVEARSTWRGARPTGIHTPVALQ
jgi:2-dehydro-3-deoxyphosphogluconate aldolase/(4S)-4-hydroxy-2-oxoglutarate aldolase